MEKTHELTLKNRCDLTLSGVTEVDSSEDRRVVLKTVLGPLVIEGRELRIRNLDLTGGEATLGGKIDAIGYGGEESAEKGKGFKSLRPGKLFR